MYETIIEQMDGLIEQEVKDLPVRLPVRGTQTGLTGDLGQLEHLVMEKVRVIGQGLLQRAVEEGFRGYQGSSLYCSECGGSLKFVGYRRKGVQTLFGWINVSRAYYHCGGGGASRYPYDEESGLGGGHLSPGLGKACCLLATEDSFEESSRKVAALMGQQISDDTIERVVLDVGPVCVQGRTGRSVALGRQEKEQTDYLVHHEPPVAEAKPDRLYICPDGTTVHEEDGWHEVKMGCIYWQNEDFEVQKRYVGDFGDSEHFGWRLWREACRCGLRQAREVVVNGDGAAWIRTERDRHFLRATFIIDWYHAAEHLWTCGKALFGDGSLWAPPSGSRSERRCCGIWSNTFLCMEVNGGKPWKI